MNTIGELLECPYNKCHQILRERFQTHLVKCRKSYPDAKKKVCPFNTTHLVNEKELKYHIGVCPDRAKVVNYINILKDKPDIEPYQRKSTIDEVPDFHAEIECTEDWSDVNVPSYNPEDYASKANIIRNKIGAKPSERKAFRQMERQRLRNFENS